MGIPHRGSPLQAPVALLVILACMGGCQTKNSQRLYFAAVDTDEQDPDLKLYRVTVSARSRNMKADYRSGFYNAQAVREFYGEVAPPGTGVNPAATPNAGLHTLAYDPVTHSWQLINNSLFTIYYGADASALAKQVSLFADSMEDGKVFGKLLGAALAGRSYLEAQNADIATKAEKAKADAMATLMKKLAGTINTAQSSDASIDGAVKELARTLAADLGLPDPTASGGTGDLTAFIALAAQRITRDQS